MPRAYATVDNMVARYGDQEMRRVSIVDGEIPDAVIPDRITGAIVGASSVADSYLSVRVPLPLRSVPDALTRAVCQIARYDLWTGGDRTPSDDVTAGRDEALAWLKAIADGKAQLDDGAAGAAAITGAWTSDRPRDLSHDSMKSLG